MWDTLRKLPVMFSVYEYTYPIYGLKAFAKESRATLLEEHGTLYYN